MSDGRKRNYYLINVIDTGENVVIPDTWICARVGGAVMVLLPRQDREKLALIGGPYCNSWNWKFAQIERGFDHYTEAFYCLNKMKTNETGKIVQQLPVSRNLERETTSRVFSDLHEQIFKRGLATEQLPEFGSLERRATMQPSNYLNKMKIHENSTTLNQLGSLKREMTTQACNDLNNMKINKNSQATQQLTKLQNSEREATTEMNINKNMSELESLLRSDSHLQLKSRNKIKSTPETLHNNNTSLSLDMLLKENKSQPEAPLKSQAQSVQKIIKELLPNPQTASPQLGDRPNLLTLYYGQVIESTVSAQLRPKSSCHPEREEPSKLLKKKNVPGLVPIKTQKYLEIQKPVNPVQIARVAPLATPSVIVFNKAAIAKAAQSVSKENSNVARQSGFSEVQNKATAPEENREEVQIEENTHPALAYETSKGQKKILALEGHRKEIELESVLKEKTLIEYPHETNKGHNKTALIINQSKTAVPEEQRKEFQVEHIERSYDTCERQNKVDVPEQNRKRIRIDSILKENKNVPLSYQKEVQKQIPYNTYFSSESMTDKAVDEVYSLSKAANNATEFIDLTETPEDVEECTMNVSSNFGTNNITLSIKPVPVKSNTCHEPIRDKVLKHNGVDCEQENRNINTSGHNQRIDESILPKTTLKSMSKTEPSTSAGASDITPNSLSLIQNKNNYSINKKNILKSILKNLEDGLKTFENLEMTRKTLSDSSKIMAKTTRETRILIDEYLEKGKTSSQSQVLKEIRPNSMDVEDK